MMEPSAAPNDSWLVLGNEATGLENEGIEPNVGALL